MLTRQILAYDTQNRPIYSDEDEYFADTELGYLHIEDSIRHTDVFAFLREVYPIKHVSDIAREV